MKTGREQKSRHRRRRPRRPERRDTPAPRGLRRDAARSQRARRRPRQPHRARRLPLRHGPVAPQLPVGLRAALRRRRAATCKTTSGCSPSTRRSPSAGRTATRFTLSSDLQKFLAECERLEPGSTPSRLRVPARRGREVPRRLRQAREPQRGQPREVARRAHAVGAAAARASGARSTANCAATSRAATCARRSAPTRCTSAARPTTCRACSPSCPTASWPTDSGSPRAASTGWSRASSGSRASWASRFVRASASSKHRLPRRARPWRRAGERRTHRGFARRLER